MRTKRIARFGLLLTALLVTAGGAQAQQKKSARPGYLGLRYDNTITISNNGREVDKIVVNEISKDSPADKAGLKSGDEILRINDMSVANGKFAAIARTLTEGDTVKLRIKRDGKESSVTVIAGARPEVMVYGNRDFVIRGDSVRVLMRQFLDTVRSRLDSLRLPGVYIGGDSTFDFRIYHRTPGGGLFADSLIMNGDSNVLRIFRARPGDMFPPERLLEWQSEMEPNVIFRSVDLGRRSVGGAELAVVDPAMADYFKTDRGLLTLKVAAETPADRAGLLPGDVVLKANDRAVNNVDDLRRIVAANPGGVKLEIMRKGQTRTLELKTRR